MPEFTTPGIFVEEISSSPPPIEGVDSSTAAFVGRTRQGPVNEAILVDGPAQFEETFGAPDEDHPTAVAVSHYFLEKGSRCWVVRALGSAKEGEREELPPAATDLVPETADGRGIFALDGIEPLSLVAIPDLAAGHLPIDDARRASRRAIAWCEARGDCILLVDSPPGLDPKGVLAYRQGLAAVTNDSAPFDSAFAALYYPWIRVADAESGEARPFPPSGAVAGAISRSAVSHGVHQAPAGVDRGLLAVASGVERGVSSAEQDGLNPAGVNVIRDFPGRGILVWGARTLASAPEWRYLAVKRLLIFLDRSVSQGTRWAVFEPNDANLWQKLVQQVEEFLRRQWRVGMLRGETEKDAFFVRCDTTTNTPLSRSLGEVVIEVGAAALRPAEFVLFRVVQRQAV